MEYMHISKSVIDDFRETEIMPSYFSKIQDNLWHTVICVFCFLFHYCLCIYTIIPFFKYNTNVALLVLFSWEMNDNLCVISQLEEGYLAVTFTSSKKAKRVTNSQKMIIYGIRLCKVVYLSYAKRTTQV